MEFGLWQVWEAGWVTAILRGASITILVGLASMAAGLVIGIACGLIKWARISPLSLVVDAYTSLVRGVPELLIIYLLFFSSVEFVTKVVTAFGYAVVAESAAALSRTVVRSQSVMT